MAHARWPFLILDHVHSVVSLTAADRARWCSIACDAGVCYKT